MRLLNSVISNALAMSTSKRDEKQQERAIDKAIDETKDSAKKVLQEVSRDLPEVTATFHDYQEHNIKQIKDMTNTYLESQKEVAKSLQSAAASTPIAGNVFMAMFFPWMHPQVFAENYVKAVTNFTDAAVSAARLSTDLLQVGMDSTRSSIDHAHANTEALSQYYIEAARTIEESVRGNERRAYRR